MNTPAPLNFRFGQLSIVDLILRAVILFGLWTAIDALAYCRLTVVGLAAVTATWLAAELVLRTLLDKWPRYRWFWHTLGICAPAGIAIAYNSGLHRPLPLGLIWYAAGFFWLCFRAWDWVLRSRGSIGEGIRIVVCLVGGWWGVLPYFTDNLVGGTDARWYAYMLTDFIEQCRSGIFPVFVGHGPFAFNGGVHPFRSAPLYMWTAGIWDWLTFRSLPVLSLQHLTVITAFAGGALGMYSMFKHFRPDRSWLAVFVALVYILSPGILAPLYCADMFMTVMAIGVLPFVIWGNAGLMIRPTKTAACLVGAGLAFMWMAHPPTGFLATLATLALQSTAWSCSGEGLMVLVGRGAQVGVWFVLTGLYYFLSMSELPPRPGPSVAADLPVILGMSAVWVGGLRGILCRDRRWTALLVAGMALLGVKDMNWFIWAAVFTGLCIGTAVVAKSSGRSRLRTPILAMVVLLVAAAISWWIAQKRGVEPSAGAIYGLRNYAASMRAVFSPLSSLVTFISDFQPGYAVLFLMGASLVASVQAHLAARVFGITALLFLVFMIRIPWVSDFLDGYAPEGIAHLLSLPLPHRLYPVTFACGAAGGFFALSALSDQRQRLVLSLMVLVVAWSGFQARNFVRRGFSATANRALTARNFMSENVVLDRFAYDLVNIPDYFSNGKVDPRLETRLLSRDQKLLVGPDQIAERMEDATGKKEVSLSAEVDATAIEWLKLSSRLIVAPSDDLLVRVGFLPGVNYTGYLIFRTDQNDYREYILPESGMPRSFGTGPQASKVISIWNTGDRPANYKLSHLTGPGCDIVQKGSVYGSLYISHFDPKFSPIRIESWLPYRVWVSASEPGFVETPRVYLRGYAATVDDRPTEVIKSVQKLAMIPIDAGEHRIVLRYVGTKRIWIGAIVSAATWMALALIAVRGVRRKS